MSNSFHGMEFLGSLYSCHEYQILHLSGMVSIFHFKYFSSIWLHLNCFCHFHIFLITEWWQIICIFTYYLFFFPICSGVTFESGKTSAASQAAKLLFLLLLENNLNIESFPCWNMADVVWHPPNAHIKFKYFWISLKVFPICPISRIQFCIS